MTETYRSECRERIAAMMRLAAGVFLVGLMLCVAGVVRCQNYPSRPIRLLTAELGGGSDLAARLIAQGLSASLGQQVIVDNRVGGVIVAEVAAQATPNGYTLLLYSGTLWILPFMRDKMPYDPVRDFAPITLVGTSPAILVVHPSVPVTSVKELIALAKAKPGELNYSTGPAGALPHLAGELFKSMAGVDLVRVAYRGVALALNDVISGRVQIMFNPNAGAVMQHSRSGRLRALAVTSAQPSPLFPDLPAIGASGVPGYEAVGVFGVFAPAKTPAPLIKRLNQEIVGFLKMPEVKARFFNAGIDVLGSSPQELAATMKAEMARMGGVIRNAGIRAQ
jgi:tripartite-type tricarboxylate transporter receptor subunit TctC